MSFLRRIRPQGEQRELTSLGEMLEQQVNTLFSTSGVTRGGRTYAGPLVTPNVALRHIGVWACLRILADTVSTMPLDVYRGSGSDRATLPLPPLLRFPQPGVPRHDWLYQLMTSLVLRGNAYALVADRGQDGRPSELFLLHPDDVTVIQPIRYGPVSYKIRSTPVATSDMWHVRAWTVPGVPVGLSPIAYAKQAIGTGLAAEEFGARFFGDGAHPTAVLETDAPVTQDQAAELKQRIEETIWGRREIAVLGRGAAWKPIQIAPDESQFLETQRWSANQICRLFGVPPEMIGVAPDTKGSLTYANREQRAQDFLTFGVLPWLVRLEAAFDMLTPAGQFCRFNPSGLLRADTKSRYEAHAIGINAGFVTRNEVRQLEDLPPLPGGDTLEVPNATGSDLPQVDSDSGRGQNGQRNGHGDTDRLRVGVQR